MKIIAEIGQAHDGSLGILHSYIDALAKTGVEAIKFQTHIAEAESSSLEPFRVSFSYEDATRYDYWKRMSFTRDHWLGIKGHCDEVGLEFISSPFSVAAVELLEDIGVSAYKIGSGEVTNNLMLDFIADTGKPVILSSGMSSYDELDEAVERFKNKSVNLTVLQCTTSYPTHPEDVGLNVIQELRERYQTPVGLSDHSGEIYPGLAAAAVSADTLEVHVVFDKSMFGPDSASSLTLSQMRDLVKGRDFIHAMRVNPIDKNDIKKKADLKKMFGKTLSVNCDINKGDRLTLAMLESKKPAGAGLSARDYQSVIGKVVKRNLSKWDFLKAEDVDES